MTVYAIGDIQGCFTELKQLLEKIHFSSDKDQLWFTGDLVNRGPDSLETLRFVKSLEDNAITVLGNHDLHMLAVLHGFQHSRPKDTFDEILKAPDKENLMQWIAHQPLLHKDESLNAVLVHAGIYPGWTIEKAEELAWEVEATLKSEYLPEFLQNMYGNQPENWDEDLQSWERLRFITNCFTRMRYCHADFALDLKYNGEPGLQPEHLQPWLNFLNQEHTQHRILFGHWSTLGESKVDNVYALDSGCLWGGRLTALALEPNIKEAPYYIHLDCKGELSPPEFNNKV